MADLLFIAIVLAFFALAAGFVKLCDRIIGPDPAPTVESPGDVGQLVDEVVQ